MKIPEKDSDFELLKHLEGDWRLESWIYHKIEDYPECIWTGKQNLDYDSRRIPTFECEYRSIGEYELKNGLMFSCLYSEWFNEKETGVKLEPLQFKEFSFSFDLSNKVGSWKKLQLKCKESIKKEGYWDIESIKGELAEKGWKSLSFHISDLQLHPFCKILSEGKMELVEHYFYSEDCETHVHNLRFSKKQII